MVVYDMITRVMKSMGKDIGKTCVSSLAFDYLLEAQFIGLFNNMFIRRQVESAVKDSLDDLVIGEIIEDYCDRICLEAVPLICQAQLEGEMRRREKEEFVYNFNEYLDRCILESVIDNISKMYEDEEREIHYRE